MMQTSLVGLLIACLCGCAAVAPVHSTGNAQCPAAELPEWLEFMDHVDALDETELLEEYRIALQRYLVRFEDEDGLRLSYLLSRPGLPVRDVAQSRELLTKIDAGSVYAPYRDLMVRELDQVIALESARRSARDLKSQLETLKGIDADLTQGQEEMEELTR